MTAPNGTMPDGAFVVGGRYGQDITEESAYAMMRGQPIKGFEDSQDSWKGLESDLSTSILDIEDGQLQLNNRVDLLEGVNGYCSTFMDANWNLAGQNRVSLPFNTQLGPSVGTSLYNGGIRLATKGLWRADAHCTFAPGSNLNIQVYVAVVGVTSESVFTEHRFDLVATSAGPETAAFSHTFVVPSDNQYYVKVQVWHGSAGRHLTYGGTVLSALSVNKWSNNTDNAVIIEDPADGGDLG